MRARKSAGRRMMPGDVQLVNAASRIENLPEKLNPRTIYVDEGCFTMGPYYADCADEVIEELLRRQT